jgi:hypothetical protein
MTNTRRKETISTATSVLRDPQAGLRLNAHRRAAVIEVPRGIQPESARHVGQPGQRHLSRNAAQFAQSKCLLLLGKERARRYIFIAQFIMPAELLMHGR